MYAKQILDNSPSGNIIQIFPGSEKEIKYRKDGIPKNVKCNKQKGKKAEVFPFQVEDIKKMTNYFLENQMWQCYLAFIIGINMARRAGDTLSLTWEHFFFPQTGKFRKDILEIVEDKTDKLANPCINSACRNAITLYLDKTKINPAENGYKNFVFVQTNGNYKGHLLTIDGYRKALKKAALAVGIEYNVGTHSTRKTFGMISRMLHPNDYDNMEILQSVFNHSDSKTTKHYIGLTKQKIDEYYNDMGTFFNEYITGNKTYREVSSKPIISVDINDLRDIVSLAYQTGKDNAQITDSATHVDAINELFALVEEIKR